MSTDVSCRRPDVINAPHTLQLLAGLALAALCGISVASLYLAIPRRPTAEEWILHRRAVSAVERPAISASRLDQIWRRPPSLSLQRYRALSEAVTRDLLLLRLAGHEAPANPDHLLESLASGAAIGAAVGAFTGLGLCAFTASLETLRAL